jgi:hypothetical protein
MTTPTITLYPDTLPAKGQAQAAFDTNVDNFLTWQTATNGPELNTFITWTVGVRDNVLATALAGDLPPLTGEALNFIRANATEDGGEFRTPAQVLSDIGAATAAQGAKADNALLAGLVFIESQDASASATIDFTSFNAALYDSYVFTLQNVIPATDTASLLMRTSSDGGSSYDSGASDYQYKQTANTRVNASSMLFASLVGSSAGEDGVSGEVKVFGPHLAKRTMLISSLAFTDSSFALAENLSSGVRVSSADVDAVRFYFNSGNITSGTITMYGMRNS